MNITTLKDFFQSFIVNRNHPWTILSATTDMGWKGGSWEGTARQNQYPWVRQRPVCSNQNLFFLSRTLFVSLLYNWVCPWSWDPINETWTEVISGLAHENLPQENLVPPIFPNPVFATWMWTPRVSLEVMHCTWLCQSGFLNDCMEHTYTDHYHRSFLPSIVL